MKMKCSTSPMCIDALAVIRVIVGILIMKHGYDVLFNAEQLKGMTGFLAQMNMPAPTFMAYLAKGTEFFGGLLLALGLFARPVSILLTINMAVAVFIAHKGEIFGAGEHAFLFLLFFVAFFFIGSGSWSIDNLIAKKCGK